MPWAMGMQAMPQEVPFDGFPTFRSVTQGFGTSSVTLAPPAGVQLDDLLVLCVMRRTTHVVSTDDPFISAAGGQTWGAMAQNFNSGYSCRVWTAICDGALTSVTIDGHDSAGCAVPAALLAYKAGTFDPANPVSDAHGIATFIASSGFSVHTLNTITTSVDKTVRLVVAGARRNATSIYANPTVDSGWTIRASQMQATGVSNNSSLTVAEKDMPTAGTTDGTDTVTEAGGNFIQAFHLAINPPP